LIESSLGDGSGIASQHMPRKAGGALFACDPGGPFGRTEPSWEELQPELRLTKRSDPVYR